MPPKTTHQIAIVDDNPIYQRIISYQLERHQYRLSFQALHGVHCLEEMERAQHLPDLIILDLEMPIMDGYETALQLKKKWPQVKIIAYSSTMEPGAEERIMENGADQFAEKSNDIQPLIQLIKEILNKNAQISN